MRIALHRGDIRLVRFLVKNQSPELSNENLSTSIDELTDIDFSEIYFTVKKNTRTEEVIFQKKLSDDGIIKIGQGDYQLKIDSSDTSDLPYGNYKFDVQLEWVDELGNTQLKESFVGDFVVMEEVTFYMNE